jgi:hypothetical protein
MALLGSPLRFVIVNANVPTGWAAVGGPISTLLYETAHVVAEKKSVPAAAVPGRLKTKSEAIKSTLLFVILSFSLLFGGMRDGTH